MSRDGKPMGRAPAPRESILPHQLERRRRRLRILLIDDDAGIRRLYQTWLESDRIEVYTAADGLDGVLLAKATAPDVIVLDLRMPVLDGWQALRRLRESDVAGNTPVVVFSGAADSCPEGASSVVTKPATAGQLLQVILPLARRT